MVRIKMPENHPITFLPNPGCEYLQFITWGYKMPDLHDMLEGKIQKITFLWGKKLFTEEEEAEWEKNRVERKMHILCMTSVTAYNESYMLYIVLLEGVGPGTMLLPFDPVTFKPLAPKALISEKHYFVSNDTWVEAGVFNWK